MITDFRELVRVLNPSSQVITRFLWQERHLIAGGILNDDDAARETLYAHTMGPKDERVFRDLMASEEKGKTAKIELPSPKDTPRTHGAILNGSKEVWKAHHEGYALVKADLAHELERELNHCREELRKTREGYEEERDNVLKALQDSNARLEEINKTHRKGLGFVS